MVNFGYADLAENCGPPLDRLVKVSKVKVLLLEKGLDSDVRSRVLAPAQSGSKFRATVFLIFAGKAFIQIDHHRDFVSSAQIEVSGELV